MRPEDIHLRMKPEIIHHEGEQPSALLVAHRDVAHHLFGVGSSLRNAGWSVRSETLQHVVPVHVAKRTIQQSHIVVHTDSDPQSTRRLRQQTESMGIPITMVMDGVLEYANTFLNPRFTHGLLRPAPADLVLASGMHDRVILEALGNQAAGVGLPRLNAFLDRFDTIVPDSEPAGLMIATANQPWFTPGMRARLLASMEQLKSFTQRLQIPIRWRVSAAIADSLGVEQDTEDLVQSLHSVQGVITTASTLAFEAMLAQKPTGLLHPHPWPLWIPAINLFRGDQQHGLDDDRERMRSLRGVDRAPSQAAERSHEQLFADLKPKWHDTLDQFICSIVHADAATFRDQQSLAEQMIQTRAADEIPTILEQLRTHTRSRSGADAPQQKLSISEHPLMQAVDALVESGFRRIVIASSTHTSPSMRTIAEHPPPELVGFVVPARTHHEVLLGLPAAGPQHFLEELQPDAMVLTAPEEDLSILGSMLWDACTSLKAVVENPENPKFAHAQTVIEQARIAAGQGEVRTTLQPGLCAGLITCDHNALLAGAPPQLILLDGSDLDFELFQDTSPFRHQGTQVLSLRWSQRELLACERFSRLTDSFGDSPYAIYGAGVHTTRLLHHGRPKSLPAFVIDDHACGSEIEGIEVLPPNHDRISDIASVVISSSRFEIAIWNRCDGLRARRIQVHRLYDNVKTAY